MEDKPSYITKKTSINIKPEYFWQTSRKNNLLSDI